MQLNFIGGGACLLAVSLLASAFDGSAYVANANEITVRLGQAAGSSTVVRTPGDGVPFSDCKLEQKCPEMVVVPSAPSGTLIGSPADEKGRLPSETQHKVSIKSFAIGKYEISVSEYLACVDAKACRHPEWLEPDGMHNIHTGAGVTYKSIGNSVSDAGQPIVGISWDDAKAYTEWLTKITGKVYRLPSEAEWEYAARGGTNTAYWWGNDVKRKGETMACCRGCGSTFDAKGFFPAKSFNANAWGLHNVHGNVWEWVADYYCDDYASGPSDGSARATQACAKQSSPEGLRIFRGGSCFYEARQMRAAMRLRNWPSFRNQTVGFRVARDL